MIAQYVTELISVTETIKGNVLHYFNIYYNIIKYVKMFR